MKVTPYNFGEFTYSRVQHYGLFHEMGCDQQLFRQDLVGDEWSSIKSYQNCLVLAFIRSFVPKGARILDVGGGKSLIVGLLQNEYECWNVDKFEGCGNGPKDIPQGNFKVVRDYMGDFSLEIPDHYFDLVFSISVLEHVPDNPLSWKRIREDMDRVLARKGYSLHCVDVTLRGGVICTNGILWELFNEEKTFNKRVDFPELNGCKDLFVLSRREYDGHWKKYCGGRSYEEWGRTFSYNVLW